MGPLILLLLLSVTPVVEAQRPGSGQLDEYARDIADFLNEPATSAFSLFHTTPNRGPVTDRYVNTDILHTGEALEDQTLKGAATTEAKLDIGQSVTPDTEVVAVRFPPVKSGQSIRLRISDTDSALRSDRLEGEDLSIDVS